MEKEALMGTIAAIVGALGGLGAVMGILTALGSIPLMAEQLTWNFWFQIAIILLLGAIALALGRRGNFE